MHNSANFAGTSKGALHTQLVIMLKHCCFYLIIKNEYYSVQARLFFYLLWSKGQNFFPTLGGQIIYFIYKNCQTPLRFLGSVSISPNGARCHSLLPISVFLSSFSNKLIKSEWNSLQLIIFKVKHTYKNFFARQEMQEI